jgi:hypothetical protein
VKFDPQALLKGSATVGYRDFQPKAPGVPAYQGATLLADLSYVAAGTTKLGVQAMRDVQYSFDVNQPYYLQTGVNASAAQQIFGPVDVVGRIGLQHLRYRERAGLTVLGGERTDIVHSYGAGIGYHIGNAVRVGVNADHDNRESQLSSRQYAGWRYGLSFTVGP